MEKNGKQRTQARTYLGRDDHDGDGKKCSGKLHNDSSSNEYFGSLEVLSFWFQKL